MQKETKFIAHRGLSKLFPENTHAAFRAAWKTDCDGIELDIQITKDNLAVVIHDPDTERTAGEKYIIADTNYEDLLHLNVGIDSDGKWEKFNERIPLLADVITEMPSGKIIQIEIKHQIDNMDVVIDSLSNLRSDIGVQIISFDPEKLLRVRRDLPELDCFLVMNEKIPEIENRLGFAVDNGLVGLDLDYQIADADYVQSILDKGLQVAHWTINDAEIARELIAQGAEIIVSDVADELKKILLS